MKLTMSQRSFVEWLHHQSDGKAKSTGLPPGFQAKTIAECVTKGAVRREYNEQEGVAYYIFVEAEEVP